MGRAGGHTRPCCAISAGSAVHWGQGCRVMAFSLGAPSVGGLRLPWRHPRKLPWMAPGSSSLSDASTPMALAVFPSLLMETRRARSLCGLQAAGCHAQLALCRGRGLSSQTVPTAN